MGTGGREITEKGFDKRGIAFKHRGKGGAWVTSAQNNRPEEAIK